MKIEKTKKVKIVKVGIILLFLLGLLTVMLTTTLISPEATFIHAPEEQYNIYKEYQLLDIEDVNEDINFDPMSAPKHPESGSISANDGTITGRNMITNYRFFTLAPRHGQNSNSENPGYGDSCGQVSAQLLLSFHNFFSDRRIIDNSFLYDGENSPNHSACPNSMTSHTLGSTAEFHRYLIRNHIPGSMWASGNASTTYSVRSGINRYLNSRNNQTEGNINFNVRQHNAGGLLNINTNRVRNELRADRPISLGMHSWLGGRDHFVVAYGYQYRNGVFGFIVHYGWSPFGSTGNTFSWIDARWVNGYVALEITHTHNHAVHADETHRELRCTICGHRTSAYATSEIAGTNSSRVTGVVGNRQLGGSVVLPQTIGGRVIISIAPSAFVRQTQHSNYYSKR